MSNSRTIDDRRRSDDIVWSRLLDRHLLEQPDEIAAVFPFHGDDSRTWRELAHRSRRLAAVLSEMGVSRGDFVAVFTENSPAMVETFLAVSQLGAVVSPVNTSFRGALLEHFLALSGSRVAVCSAALLSCLVQVDSLIETILVEGPEGMDAPLPVTVLGYDGGDRHHRRSPT